ncbi:NAD-dependent epimerase/dehydratase family protein [Nocardiopsis mangrovi]|uniref:NAD-dependent epimerase/dehydratase family protein n=1 Tax=Nocardiopsis mangrovi TaxID=1179818 RepID=A0ABV9DT42_9ACTN
MNGGRVAVLGGTGWVGRHVCAAFAREGREVVVAARAPAPHTAAHRFHRVDLATAGADDVARLLRCEDIGLIVNATDAANARDGWAGGAARMAAVNVDAVHAVVAAAARAPRRPRLVHLGTLHEYGPRPPGTAVDEDTEPRPANDYARSKLAGSLAVLEAARSGAVDGLVLRLANVCGPHPSPVSFPGLLLRLFRAAAAGERPELRVARARRDFVDVADTAEAVLLAGLSPPAPGRVLNIGGGRAVPIAEMVDLMAEVTGVPRGAFREGPAPAGGIGGDWSLADTRRAERVLGWRARTGVRASLHAMWTA